MKRLNELRYPMSAALAAVLIIALALPALGEKLVCSKGEPPAGAAVRGRPKIFVDEVPEVGAIELAAERGRSRDGRTTVRLLALRVAFQPDNDGRSTGNGGFDYGEWDGATFDGPPHDREYFELHMTALNNYYSSMSYGQLELEFDVMPAAPESAYVLPEKMGYYHDYSEAQVWYVSQVEEFTRDAFAAADTMDSIDFSQYDGFVLFHAGADWQSDINLDSPFDIPSAHILLGEPILVNDDSVEVWGAAIMPETSSQDGLTMVLNGTLAHEVGHILGLPDLYNTSNFWPAIGQWGLMDSGGSIGMSTPWGWAYGLLPASVCGWSKEFMGWVDPVVLLDDSENVRVTATEIQRPGFKLFKIPITTDEYFLIENRLDDFPESCDPGDTLAIVAIDQERGVVLGPVDPCLEESVLNHEYDFLLPGPGMLIYHIDDTRVQPGLMPYDTVNVDRKRYGVAVEEADGIMDLGNILSFYWSGNRYDPFFDAGTDGHGNQLHANRFSWDTYPSTDTNMGGRTYVTVANISEIGEEMTMDVSFDRWKPGWPFEIDEPLGTMTPRVADLDGDGDGEVVVASESGSVYAWHHEGTPMIPLCGVLGRFALASGGMTKSPVAADIDGDGTAEVIAASARKLYAWDYTDNDTNGFADPHASGFPVSIDGPASSSPLVADLSDEPGLEIAVATGGGDIVMVDELGSPLGSSPYSFGHLVLEDVCLAAGDLDGDGLCEVISTTTNRGWVIAINEDGTSVPGWPVYVDDWIDETAQVVVGDIDRAPDGKPEVVAVGSSGVVHAWDASGNELGGWPVDLGRRVSARPSLGDLDGDGFLEVVIPAGTRAVCGLRANGTRAENWPFEMDTGDSTRPVQASALIGDIDGDSRVDVLSAGPGGSLFLRDALSGEAASGWPYSADPTLGTPWAGDIDGDDLLDILTVGTSGRVLLMGLPYAHEAGSMIWSTEGGDASGSGAYPDSLLPGAPADEDGLLVSDRTYCYPNPARESDLTVRVFLEGEADIEVEIMDVSGEVVARFEREGEPTVNEIVWETSGVASGLYIVRVVATEALPTGYFVEPGSSLPSVSKTMKVAVLR